MMETGRAPVERSGSTGGSAGPDKLLTIGQLVRELQAEFPDLSISKVRYLENRGLITPARSEGRYRKFGREDMRRLRKILAMQRDEYLPLEVIRHRLDQATTGSSRPQTSGVGGTSSPVMKLSRQKPLYTLEELCEAAGAEEEFVLTLVEFRLIDRSVESGPVFTDSDVETVRVCHRLARFDVEPRNLRILSSAAEREAALIEQVATPSLRSAHADRKQHGLEMIEDLGTLFAQLMQLLLRRELERLL